MDISGSANECSGDWRHPYMFRQYFLEHGFLVFSGIQPFQFTGFHEIACDGFCYVIGLIVCQEWEMCFRPFFQFLDCEYHIQCDFVFDGLVNGGV